MSKGRFSIEAAFKAVDGMTRPVARMSSSVTRMVRRTTSGLRRLDRGFATIHRGIRRVATAMLGVGAAGALVGRHIIGAGSSFEQAITNVGAVGLQTRSEIAELEEKALSLGKTTKFTATEAANAMELMRKSGFSTTDVLAGVEGVLNAAAASGLEMAEVADHVSNALKGFGMQTDQASRVADVLALASSRTNSTIGTLGESLRNVASTAKQLKVPFEDAVAGVALLQDVGLDASVAGSAMATMLTKMAKPAAAVKKQMKDFGVTFKHSVRTAAEENERLIASGSKMRVVAGDMLSLPKVLEQLSIAAEKSGGSFDKVAFFADLVGLRGQKAATNLADLFASGKFSELTEQLRGAEGAAKQMADLRLDSVEGEWTLLKSAIDGVTQGLFGLEGGALKDTIKGMRDWVSANQDVIVSGVQEFIADIRDNLPKIVLALEAVGKALVIFYGMATAIKAANAAMTVFNLLMTMNPLGAFVVLIGVAIGMWVMFKDEIMLGWETISEWFKRLDFAEMGKAMLKGIAKGLLGWAPHLYDAMKTVLGKLRDMLPFSPAKIGPLRDLDKIKLSETIAATIKPEPITTAMQGVLKPVATFGPMTTQPSAAPTPRISPQVLPPRAVESRNVERSESVERVEVVVRGEGGAQAEIRPRDSRRNSRLSIAPSGSF